MTIAYIADIADIADTVVNTEARNLAATVAESDATNVQAARLRVPELMAPGHLYNPRTGTGIEWLPASPGAGEPGRVRLWTRRWNGQPSVLFESEHRTRSLWDYWYNLEFARSFPEVTHWWFGDAWTGQVHIWMPEAAAHDPESQQAMLIGWMRFGPQGTPLSQSSPGLPGATDAPGRLDMQDTQDWQDGPDSPALPWTVVLTSPPRVNTPFPPMCANIANLPLQLLLGEKVIEALSRLSERTVYPEEMADDLGLDLDIAVTSLVRREDLHTAFPNELGSWCLDRLPGMTPREALCRVQGLEQVPELGPELGPEADVAARDSDLTSKAML